jgi:hypothetical protein
VIDTRTTIGATSVRSVMMRSGTLRQRHRRHNHIYLRRARAAFPALRNEYPSAVAAHPVSSHSPSNWEIDYSQSSDLRDERHVSPLCRADQNTAAFQWQSQQLGTDSPRSGFHAHDLSAHRTNLIDVPFELFRADHTCSQQARRQ